MDEKMVAVVGAVAGLALAGRGLRPLAKLAMRGVVATTDVTAGARRQLGELYAEAKAEQRRSQDDAGSVSASAPVR